MSRPSGTSSVALNLLAHALLARRLGGMFRLVTRVTHTLALLAGITAVASEVTAQGGSDAWRPQTVPLWGASYAPDIGLLVGVGVSHTRYGFHALPPSTRLLGEVAYATSATTYRVDAAGEFRRALLPALLYVELRASGLALIRVHASGTDTVVCHQYSILLARASRQ